MVGLIEQKYTFLEVLEGRWWVALVAFITALVATPIVRTIAYRKKIVDRPDDLLKPHGRPVAYLGGLGIYLGLLVGLAVYVSIMPGVHGHWRNLIEGISTASARKVLKNPLWNLGAIALASLVITLVGLMDDLKNITPKKKVMGQIVAAGILLAGGVGIHMINVLLSLAGIHFPVWLVYPLSSLLCVTMVIAACNATNLLDGLDGLCGGVTGIISLGFLALAIWLATWGRFPGTDELRVVLCLAMAGTIFGFLPYNIPPASVFMGDAGSMLLGFFVAVMMALFCQEGLFRWFLAACVVFALPILDTALAVVRRLRAGVSIFTGDRSHLYDQLVDRGMSIKQVVVLFYVLAATTAVLGVVLAITMRTRHVVIIYGVLLVAVWTLFAVLGMVAPPPKTPKQQQDTATPLDAQNTDESP